MENEKDYCVLKYPLARAARGTELQAIVAAAIGAGLRRGELLGPRWSDIDLDARRLTVRRSLETHKGVTLTKATEDSAKRTDDRAAAVR
jgi:integrase